MAGQVLREIFVVDDDAAIRAMVAHVLARAGYEAICFADGETLVKFALSRIPTCILLDVKIPGKSGIDILKELQARDYPAPIFVMSGHGDIAMAVDAIQSGALDFIEKPFRGSELVERIKFSIAALLRRRERTLSNNLSLHFPGREPLSCRELEVLELISKGARNKEAAVELGISSRTVEDHRSNIMRKLGARNITELLRRVLEAEG